MKRILALSNGSMSAAKDEVKKLYPENEMERFIEIWEQCTEERDWGRSWGRNDLNLFSTFKWVRSPARWRGAGRGMRVPSGPLLVSRTGAAG